MLTLVPGRKTLRPKVELAALRERDDHFDKMLDVAQACYRAGVDLPAEVAAYFAPVAERLGDPLDFAHDPDAVFDCMREVNMTGMARVRLVGDPAFLEVRVMMEDVPDGAVALRLLVPQWGADEG